MLTYCIMTALAYGDGDKAPHILNVYMRRRLFKFLPLTLSTREQNSSSLRFGEIRNGVGRRYGYILWTVEHSAQPVSLSSSSSNDEE